MSQAKKVVATTFILIAITLFTKLISFVRQILVAAQFGTSSEADIFVSVITIPTSLLIIASGALAAALVPMIIKLRNNNESLRLEKLVSSMFSLTTLAMLLLTAVLYIFIEPFMNLYVVGFSPEAKLYAIELLKIMIPAMIAIGLISLSSAILNAHQHFVVPSLGPISYSGGVIIALIFFSDTYGIESLIIGYSISVFFQLAILLIVIFKKKIRFSPKITITQDVKKVGILILPFFISLAVFQLNNIVDKMMGSTLPEGNLAALNYAFSVSQLPISIFVGSLVLPLFSLIADYISKNDFTGTKDILIQSNRLLGILLLPVMGAFIVVGEPIIAMIYQRGEFDINAVETTSLALMFYTFSILPYSLRDVTTRALYALQDTWTPVINSIFLVAVNITLMLIFVPRFGLIAIAGSTSISAIVGYIRLRYKLVKKIGRIGKQEDKILWGKILINAIIFTIITWLSNQGLLYIWSNNIGVQLWLRTILSLFFAALIYLYLTLKLNTTEINYLKQKIRTKLKK